MEKITHTIDLGKNNAVVYDVEKNIHTTISHKELLELPFTLPVGSVVASEAAHLAVPKTRKSRAQTFPAETLLELYHNFEAQGITFKLTAQDSAPRARTVAVKDGVIKQDDGLTTDEQDSKALAHFLNTHDSVRSCLQNPPKSFEPNARHNDSIKFKDDVSVTLNEARDCGYQPSESAVVKIVYDNIEELYDFLSEKSRHVLRLERNKNGKINKTVIGKSRTSLVTLAATVFDVDGNPLCRFGNVIPGWTFIRRKVLGMSPNHRKGGVARSNLFFHGLKGYVQRSTSTGSKSQGTYKPLYEGVDFRRTFLMDHKSKGKEMEVIIKRGHMNDKENKMFLELRKDFVEAMKELHTFYSELAATREGYVLASEQHANQKVLTMYS